jgi:hypothetical protein
MGRLKSANQQCRIKNEEYEKLVNEAVEAYCQMPSSQKARLLTCARRFGVPKSTISACLNGRISKLESAQLRQKLFPQEEQVLVEYLKDSACRGFPDTREQCERRANEILRTRSMGLEHPVSSSWLDRFLDHHGTSICTFWSKTHSSLQGGALNETVVNHWFQLLEEIVTKYSIAPDCIFSMDETSTFLDKPTSKTLHIGATESSRQPIAIRNENRETATLIPIISAAGKVFKPTIIFKGE